jgi:hypothetical protein
MLHVTLCDRHAKYKELLTGIWSFSTRASLILLEGPQILTFLYMFSTLHPPPHTNRQGSGTLLVQVVFFVYGVRFLLVFLFSLILLMII